MPKPTPRHSSVEKNIQVESVFGIPTAVIRSPRTVATGEALSRQIMDTFRQELPHLIHPSAK